MDSSFSGSPLFFDLGARTLLTGGLINARLGLIQFSFISIMPMASSYNDFEQHRIQHGGNVAAFLSDGVASPSADHAEEVDVVEAEPYRCVDCSVLLHFNQYGSQRILWIARNARPPKTLGKQAGGRTAQRKPKRNVGKHRTPRKQTGKSFE